MSKGNFLFATVSGKLGDMVLYRTKGQQRARTYLGSGQITDPNTELQVEQRTQLANLVALYRQCKDLLSSSFVYKKEKQSDYNAFVSRNLNVVKVWLSKEEAAYGTSIVAPYVISYGGLTPIEVSALSSGGFRTNIEIGDLELSSSTTIAELSEAILDNNQAFSEGMKINYASFIQNTNAETNYPYVTLGLYGFTLDLSDTSLVYDVFPEFCCTAVDGYIGTGSTLASGGFAYIVSSRNEDGGLEVSTQRIVLNNAIYANYTSDSALSNALKSYDAQDVSQLSTDSITSSTVTVSTSVSYVSFKDTNYYTGNENVYLDGTDSLEIYGNGLSSIESVTVTTVDSSSSEEIETEITAFEEQDSTHITLPSATYATYLVSIALDGVVYATFDVDWSSIEEVSDGGLA